MLSDCYFLLIPIKPVAILVTENATKTTALLFQFPPFSAAPTWTWTSLRHLWAGPAVCPGRAGISGFVYLPPGNLLTTHTVGQSEQRLKQHN